MKPKLPDDDEEEEHERGDSFNSGSLPPAPSAIKKLPKRMAQRPTLVARAMLDLGAIQQDTEEGGHKVVADPTPKNARGVQYFGLDDRGGHSARASIIVGDMLKNDTEIIRAARARGELVVGDRVNARSINREWDGWRAAIVKSCEHDTYDIETDDRNEHYAAVARRFLRLRSESCRDEEEARQYERTAAHLRGDLVVGDGVDARLGGGSTWYRGTVTACADHGRTYTVKYSQRRHGEEAAMPRVLLRLRHTQTAHATVAELKATEEAAAHARGDLVEGDQVCLRPVLVLAFPACGQCCCCSRPPPKPDTFPHWCPFLHARWKFAVRWVRTIGR